MKNFQCIWFTRILFLLSLCLSLSAIGANTNEEFPGRQLFPDAPYIELPEFYQQLKKGKVNVVDVRSNYEYETLHIVTAVNIPLDSARFKTDAVQLQQSNNKPIVVYCNGKTCMKSYNAVQKLKKYGINNAFALDTGILDFAQAYPQDSLLLGGLLQNANRLISHEDFKKHLISPESFERIVTESNSILLDIRERVQREDGISIFVGKEHRVTLDNSKNLDKYIFLAKKNKSPLLVYDAAGKQVQWLQYYLKEKNLSDYYFMDGGITAYYKDLNNP